MLTDVERSILESMAAVHDLTLDWRDFRVDVVNRMWWRVWGVAAETASLFPTYLSEQFLDAMQIQPLELMQSGVEFPVPLYGGEWGARNVWDDTTRPLFDPLTENVAAPGGGLAEVYAAGAHTAQCVNPDFCQLECVANQALIHFGFRQ